MKTLLLLMTVIFSLLNIGCESSGDDSGPSTPNNNPNTKNLLEVLNNKPFQTNCIKTKSNSYGLLELRKSNQNTILLNVKLFDDELCTENNKLINQYTLKSSNENYKLSEDRRENLGSLTVQSVSSESMKISLKSTEISALIDIQSSQTLTAYNYLSSAALITAGSKLKLEADSFYKTFTTMGKCS